MSKFLISCGGTGGHLSPGIALAEGLLERGHGVTLLISEKKVDARLVEKYPGLDFVRVPGRGFAWNPVGLIRCLASQARGLVFCNRLIRMRRPDAVVGFGGFTSSAVVLAARLNGVPVALHEANRVPGLATRVFGRLADRVYLPPAVRLPTVRTVRVRHMGLPVRREIRRLDTGDARRALGLDPDRRVLAILGGSQGAGSLNAWARRDAGILAAAGIQVYCVTGLGKGEAGTQELAVASGGTVKAVFTPFCDRMAELLSAADLVVSRAGAGTLAELVRCATPAILVPYPHAADDHQSANASFFERQGGGIVVADAAAGILTGEVLDAISNEWLLRQFGSNLRRMDRANSLDLMLLDLEGIVAGRREPGPMSRIAAAA